MEEREAAKRIKTDDRQSISYLKLYKLGTLNAVPNFNRDQCRYYDISNAHWEDDHHKKVLIWKEVKEELDKRGASITYDDSPQDEDDEREYDEDRREPFEKLQHGDTVSFSDYPYYTYIAFKKDITKDDDEFLLLRTREEHGYCIPFHFSDAPEDFFQYSDCNLCDPRHLFPGSFTEAKCRTIPKEKFENIPDCLVEYDDRDGINQMNIISIPQWYGSLRTELPQQYLLEHKLFLEYYEARMMPVWKEAKKKTERLLAIILKDLQLPSDILGVIAWFVVCAPVSVC